MRNNLHRFSDSLTFGVNAVLVANFTRNFPHGAELSFR